MHCCLHSGRRVLQVCGCCADLRCGSALQAVHLQCNRKKDGSGRMFSEFEKRCHHLTAQLEHYLVLCLPIQAT